MYYLIHNNEVVDQTSDYGEAERLKYTLEVEYQQRVIISRDKPQQEKQQ